jgi:hypothetical protein
LDRSDRISHLLALGMGWSNPVPRAWGAVSGPVLGEVSLVRLPDDIRASVLAGVAVPDQLAVQDIAPSEYVKSWNLMMNYCRTKQMHRTPR